MTASEEAAIDSHIWQSREYAYITLWSTLKRNKTFYDISLIGLAQYGNVICKIIGNDDIVGFTRILDHIGLPIEFEKSGIRLKKNAKLIYRESKMYKKPLIITDPYQHEKKFNRVGKKEADYDKPGWCDRKFADEKDDP